MNYSQERCPIWGTPSGSHIPGDGGATLVPNSYRAYGSYRITLDALFSVSNLDDQAKARLTTWLVEQHLHGTHMPLITTERVEMARSASSLSVARRADRLLQMLANKSTHLGEEVWILAMRAGDDGTALGEIPKPTQNLWEAMAWSETADAREIDFLAEYLQSREWLVTPREGSRYIFVVTSDGYSHLEAQATKSLGDQAFVAMWFDDETDEAFEHGIRLAIEETGYTAMRIDRKEHINKIDDEIIAEIRRSRFLVADFSQGDDGARGGVYYEAGFANGLNIPVIYTCRKSDIDKLHFDTRQYNHIVWGSPEELREALRNRILAIIGEGPSGSGG